MSSAHDPDASIAQLAHSCTRLDEITDKIHADMRAGRPLGLDVGEIRAAIAEAADASSEALRNADAAFITGAAYAVSFTLRAAHEALQALIAAKAAEIDAQNRTGSFGPSVPPSKRSLNSTTIDPQITCTL